MDFLCEVGEGALYFFTGSDAEHSITGVVLQK